MTRLRILQVEDDHDILDISKIALEAIGGHEVFQFSDGNEAIAKAEEISPDLILLDVLMPRLSGQETLEQLRSLPKCKQVPVIFMTAKTQEEVVNRLRDIGAAGIVIKPFDPIALSADIANILSSTAV
ncbi:response regulator [Pararhodobacter zhoushanensis]|uniref:response regulator n=1 Tax=Pararhodobacter zhoushanensis TaxID=2479545 RepID=UPI000F8F565D|nr:response regulator [Pararhodobacter zhoushanensis]